MRRLIPSVVLATFGVWTPAAVGQPLPGGAAESVPSAEARTAAPPGDELPADTASEEPSSEASMSEAELAAIIGAEELAAEEYPNLRVYGFADTNYRHLFADDDNPWLLILNRHGSAYLGNLNLYVDSQIARDWRSLAEVRFSVLPHGARRIGFASGAINRHVSRESDPANFQRDRNVGGIILERAWLEYANNSWFNVRVGQWLTPYGIWVVDHGSPVIIGVNPPFLIGGEYIPERQTGVQARGSGFVAENLELAYALGLSNGRSDVSAMEDMDGNKAVTARLALTWSGLGEMSLGSSLYYGRYTWSVETIRTGASGGVIAFEDIREQYDELAYAVDYRWVVEGFHFQAEGLMYERQYVERGRTVAPDGGLNADHRKWGGYALAGYRLPFFPLMPYFKGEYSPDRTAASLGIPDRVAILSGGLNYRPVPAVVLKAEYTHAFFPDSEDDQTGLSKNNVDMLEMQAAWAF